MKKSHIQLLIGCILSLLFLYLALRGVNVKDLWHAMRAFQWVWAIPFLFLTIFSMWIRAWRWHYLLKPALNLKTKELFGPMMAGFALNGLLPARIGEFARAYILAKKHNAPFTKIFATIVVERIFDTLTLLALLSVVFLTLEFDPNVSYPYSTQMALSSISLAVALTLVGILLGLLSFYLKRNSKKLWLIKSIAGLAIVTFILAIITKVAAPETLKLGKIYELNGGTLKKLSLQITFASVILLSGTIALLWNPIRNLALSILQKLPLLPDSLKSKICTIVESFTEGLHSLKDFRTIIILTLQSIAVWMLCAWSMQILPYGFTGMEGMTISEATALLVITCLAILIPAAPGYWGLMELGMKFGIVILSIDNDPNRIMAYALLVHSLQYFSITGIGLYALWKDNITLGELSNTELEKP